MGVALYGVNIWISNGGILFWKTTNGILKTLKLLFDTDIIHIKYSLLQTAIYIMFPHKMQWGMNVNMESLQKYKRRTLPRTYRILALPYLLYNR
jgi:hypothetical protein